MEDAIPSMTRLFEQLGLPASPPEIQAFIAAHKPLADSVRLHQAAFWSAGQAEFLCSEMAQDTDWAIVIERLNGALREPEAH